jgi:hypothetical protein
MILNNRAFLLISYTAAAICPNQGSGTIIRAARNCAGNFCVPALIRLAAALRNRFYDGTSAATEKE